MSVMTPNRPYLIEAFYRWIVDNQLTPYILVDTSVEGVQVPLEYVKEDRIVLNISPTACQGLHIRPDRVVFSARFSGEVMQIFVPPRAVQAVYARENGRGIIFEDEDFDEEREVMAEDGASAVSPITAESETKSFGLHEGFLRDEASPESTEQTKKSSAKKDRPNLTIVK